MRKKWICVLLTALLVCAPFGGVATVWAEEPTAPALSLSWERPEDGQIRVDVKLAGNPGITAYQMQLDYDDEVLTPKTVTCGAICAAGIGMFESNFQEEGSGGFDVVDGHGYVTGVWAADAAVAEDGVLFSVVFQVNEETLTSTAVSLRNTELFQDNMEGVNVAGGTEDITIYGNRFSLSETDPESSLSLTGGRVTGTVAAVAASYGEKGYQGEALAFLACYRDGRLCGVIREAVTIAENADTSFSLTAGFETVGSGAVTVKLILLKTGSCAPLAECLIYNVE